VTHTDLFSERRLKYTATINDEALSESTDCEFELAYIDIGNVDSQGRVHDIVSYRFEDAPSRARRIVRDGDVIISTVRTYLQAIAPVEDPPDNLIVSTGFAVVRPSHVLDHRFCKYALRANRFLWEVESRSTGVSYPAINASDLGDIKVNLPEVGAQRHIADHLDRETARIDGLIAEKQHMLALLEEKRSVLISRVVTRGLDSNAPLKPSGQEWLGEIPAHWELRRIKFVSAWLDQGSSPIASNTPAGSDELGVLKLSAVSKGRFKREENKALRGIEEGEQPLALRKGDVLITRGNTPDIVADVACVLEDEPNLLLPDLIYRLRVKEEKILAEYLTAFLTTAEARFQIRRDARGSSGSMVKVSQGHVLDWLTPLPPLFEQVEIMNYLRRTEERFQSIAREVSSSLSLLSDRRAALISAAVTGQIPLEEMTE
jgi:type I restriction enzyme, S subunit